MDGWAVSALVLLTARTSTANPDVGDQPGHRGGVGNVHQSTGHPLSVSQPAGSPALPAATTDTPAAGGSTTASTSTSRQAVEGSGVWHPVGSAGQNRA